jgi:hypothetical protein
MPALAESLEKAAGIFPRRFLFNALLPTLIFTTGTTLAIALCLRTPRQISALWTGTDTFTRVVTGLLYLALVWFIASAVASQWRNIVRVFEGYPVKHWMQSSSREPVGVRFHQGRLAVLRRATNGDVVSAYYNYPRTKYQNEVLPTRLGNILLAGERYPLDRYGIDAIIFWPRLFPLLPESFQRDYEEFLQAYEFPVVVALHSCISTLIVSGALLLTHQPPATFVAVLVAGFALAYASYVLGLSSARELAEQMKTAFDLYRDRLLEGWPTADDVHDEEAAFRDIESFVLYSKPIRWGAAQKAHHDRRQSPT